MIGLVAACIALVSFNPVEGSVTVDVSSERYSDATRDAEDRMKEVLYLDLNGRDVDYANLDRAKIQQISIQLRAAHHSEIEVFTRMFVRDEIAAGASEAEARARAAEYVDDYLEALWDVQIALANGA